MSSQTSNQLKSNRPNDGDIIGFVVKFEDTPVLHWGVYFTKDDAVLLNAFIKIDDKVVGQVGCLFNRIAWYTHRRPNNPDEG